MAPTPTTLAQAVRHSPALSTHDHSTSPSSATTSHTVPTCCSRIQCCHAG